MYTTQSTHTMTVYPSDRLLALILLHNPPHPLSRPHGRFLLFPLFLFIVIQNLMHLHPLPNQRAHIGQLLILLITTPQPLRHIERLLPHRTTTTTTTTPAPS